MRGKSLSSFSPAKIMISAGEVSGDLQASHLVKALYKKNPSLSLFGCGGEKCQQAGMEVLLDLTRFNTVGLVESLRYLSYYRQALKKINLLLDKRNPQLVILVDNQGFNLNVAKLAKRRGIPTLYYLTPQVWLWGEWNAPRVARLITQLVAIYKKEYQVYQKAGARIEFVGHPLFDTIKLKWPLPQIYRELKLDSHQPVIGLFPGSRRQEIFHLLPLILKSAQLIKRKIKAQFVLSPASSWLEPEIRQKVKSEADFVKIIPGCAYEIMKIARLIITSSGTTTLEAAYFQTPQIVLYQISKLTYWLAKRLVKYPFISLPNILAEEEIIPELLQKSANPQNVARLAERILLNSTYTQKMKEKLGEVIRNLGPQGGAMTRIAQIALSMIKSQS
jgi:lipid-A-disaccharide synthase